MKTNYTKGPWIARRWTAYKGDYHILSKEEGIIATVTGRGGEFAEEDAANSHLVAAAPELLELAQAALEWIDAVPSDTVLPTMPGFDRDWANDLIARATTPTQEGGL